MPSTIKTILVLAANPKDTSRLRLEKEVREIDSGLQRAQKRESFVLKQVWAVRPSDFRRAMLDFRPNIVHFCGHGSGEEGIALENDAGNTRLVNADALAGFFRLFSERIECVVLNACYSDIQADAISQYIKRVIGMRRGISDNSAIDFAVAFYDALGAGENVDFAYELACNAIQWTTTSEHSTPVLKSNDQYYLAHTNANSATELDTLIGSGARERTTTYSKGIKSPLAELDDLVGMQPAKDFIRSAISRMKLAERMSGAGSGTKVYPLGCIAFCGNPGTGKTTMAYLLGRILVQMGALDRGHVVQVSRIDLVGMYVGQTTAKTTLVVEQALDGILFIDDAFHLSAGSGHDFGTEAVSTLIAQMDRYRDRLVVIMSGYRQAIMDFLASNLGLDARIAHRIDFPDFTPDELLVILERKATEEGFVLSPAAASKAREYFQHRSEVLKDSFGNAVEVRRLLEMSKSQCATRVFRDNVDVQAKLVIEQEDIPIV